MSRVAAVIALGTLVAVVAPSALAAPTRGEPTISVQYRNEDVSEILTDFARATGQTYLFDERVRGRVTITTADRVTLEEARELINAALLLKGFAIVPSPGGARLVVPLSEAAARAPWIQHEDDPDSEGEGPVATLVRLEAVSATDLIAALKPLIGQSVIATPLEGSNSVILAGSEARLRRLIGIARDLDEAATEELTIFRLRHRTVDSVGPIVREVFPDIELWEDPRTEALIVRTTGESTDALRDFLRRIDRAPEASGDIHVLPIKNRDAESLGEILQSLASAPAGRRPGDRLESASGLAGRAYTVVVDVPTRALVIQADPGTYGLIQEVVAELDQPPPRISVEVVFYEITLPSQYSLAFDAVIPLLGSDDSNTRGLLELDPSGGGLRAQAGGDVSFLGRLDRDPVLVPIDIDGQTSVIEFFRENYAITANARGVRSKLLSRPHMVMVSGEEHEIFIGNNIPVPVASASPSELAPGVGLSTQQTINRQDVGIRVRVRPTVGQAGTVQLSLDLSLTSLVASVAGAIEQVGPTFSNRDISVKTHVRDGEAIVIALATERIQEEVVVGTPFFSKIPVIGTFFRSTDRRWVNSQLIVTVEAKLLRNSAELMAQSIRRRIALERNRARVRDLVSSEYGEFAVLLEVYPVRESAEQAATRFSDDGQPAEVTRWVDNGKVRYDVYLLGFDSLADAAEASNALNDAGWTPEVVVLRPSAF